MFIIYDYMCIVLVSYVICIVGRMPASLGWQCLSNATCPMRPRLFCVFRRVKDHHTLLRCLQLLKKVCVRQGVRQVDLGNDYSPRFQASSFLSTFRYLFPEVDFAALHRDYHRCCASRPSSSSSTSMDSKSSSSSSMSCKDCLFVVLSFALVKLLFVVCRESCCYSC